MKNTIYTIVFVMMASISYVQGQDIYKPFNSKVDVGLNVTSVISSFTGNGSFLNPSDQPLLLRFNRSRSTIRLGLGARGTSSEFNDFISGSLRTSTEQEFFVKLGLENPIKTGKKVDGYFGFDFVSSFQFDKVRVESFTTTPDVVITKNTVGFGISPFVGIRYFISPRVYLSTEANFLFMYQSTTSKDSGTGGTPGPSVTTNAERFELNPPLFLYFNFKL